MAGRHPRIDPTRGELALGTIQNGEKRAPIQLTNDGALEVETVNTSEMAKDIADIKYELSEIKETLNLTNMFLQSLAE